MREIKFRAWDKKKNLIREVAEIRFDGKYYDVRIIEPTENAPRNWSLRNFDEIELMQFTGLLDKNGKEIYEGDWCRAKFRTRDGIQEIQGHIIMDDFMWCIDCTGCIGDDIFSINRPHDFEVIGNIHENPELLTKQ